MKSKKFNTERYNILLNDKNVSWEQKFRVYQSIKTIGKNKKVLDVGCYDGYFAEKIKDMGNDVLGLDISEQAVKLCNQRGIKCIEADLEERLPLKDKTFDVIYAGGIIEHVFDTDNFLKELNRILKYNGVLLLDTPNIAALNKRIKLLMGKNPDTDIGIFSLNGKKSSGHIRYFTIKTLEKLLNRNGFSITEFKTDFILFNRFRLIKLGKLFPRLGWTIIIRARKNETTKD
ncbi:MAG: class I SAM-dependent methyltransferase [Candidatus Nanoarchaeia archaeon]|nr:class I SAM-dependent methyltransferase [Candidatus Nanoarchaeia archaeon]